MTFLRDIRPSVRPQAGTAGEGGGGAGRHWLSTGTRAVREVPAGPGEVRGRARDQGAVSGTAAIVSGSR